MKPRILGKIQRVTLVVARNARSQAVTTVDAHPTWRRGTATDQGTNPYPMSRVPLVPRPDAPAKLRILATADRLFYEDGIRAVGIDRLISESGVTKATFYKHWGSKDRLILHYLQGRHDRDRTVLEGLVLGASTTADIIVALAGSIADDLHQPGFRGCPFINAAAEYSDPTSDARKIISMHRDWYTAILTRVLRDGGHPLPGDGADELLLARDGAMVGGYAGDPVSAAAALRRTVARIAAEL